MKYRKSPGGIRGFSVDKARLLQARHLDSLHANSRKSYVTVEADLDFYRKKETPEFFISGILGK